jgi:predicted permease
MRFYRALLHLFPRSFRAEYGAEMTKDLARQWNATGGIAALGLILTTLVDVVVNAMRVHADILAQDVRYALRSLRRTPGFTFTAILVAALGIGATTATFSIADHVLLRPLPFEEPDRLVRITEDHTSIGYPRMEPSPPNYLDWKRMATSLSIEAFVGDSRSLVGSGEPERIFGASMAGGAFALLGRQAAIGRTLSERDAADETQNPVVLSDRMWRTRFAADPTVLGRTLTLDTMTLIIVGVMPPDFFFPSRDTDYWRLLRLTPANGDNNRGNNYLGVMARLKPGFTFEQARSEMRTVADQIAQQFPKEQTGKSVNVNLWRDDVNRQIRLMLWALVGAAICLLLIACTNLANLLLSRALSRQTEMAVRTAVGASVDRLVRQMMTDSLLLAGVGGLLGIGLAIAAAPMVVRLVPTALPIADVPPVDFRMLAVAAFITISTGIAFGVMPALRMSRKIDASALKEGARGGTSRGTERLRSSLVIAEIVASVVLLVSAGLLIQALLKVQAIDPGFRSENVLTLKTMLSRTKYPQARRYQFYRKVISDTLAVPGVQRAAYISFTPFTMRGGMWEILTTTPDPTSLGGFAAPPDVRRAALRFVTPGYFETVGIPILQGRDVAETDTPNTTAVAVVSESFAHQQFPGQDPIGRSFGFVGAVRTIVGVVGDIRFRGLERNDSEPQVYVAAFQQPDNAAWFYAPQDLIVRTSVPPETLMPAVRAIIRKADPQLPITNMRTLEDVVSLETAPRVVQLRVLGAFAIAAFLLAAIGIHGLLAFTVSSRSREIGVRIALGAKAKDIMWMVMSRSTTLAIIGVLVGAVIAYAAGRSMQALLFGVDPADIAVFSAAIGLSLLMALAGSIIPAWRAIRVDPMTATRTD